MADDTRKSSTGGADDLKALPRDPNQEEHTKPRVFVHRPNETAEEEAEGRRKASLFEAAKTIKAEDFGKVAQTPCVRNALLPGIGAGVAIGAARFVIGASVLSASNWASGGFVGMSMIMYQVCQRARQREKNNIRAAVKVLDEKQAIKDAKTGQPLQAGGYKPQGQSLTASESPPPQASQGDNPKAGVPFWQSFKFW